MGYYLLDNRRGSANWYTTRRSSLRVIVMHITAGLEDLDATNDHSAENTARYAATTDRAVSWHAGADADSFFYLLPASYTAYHCRGYNSLTWGLEISKRHVKWAGMDPRWVEKTLWNSARAVAPVCRDYSIPRRLLSKAQVDRGEKGFTAHAFLDPTRRSDPGADFPWDRFFTMVNQVLGGIPVVESKPLPEAEPMGAVALVEHHDGNYAVVYTHKQGLAFAWRDQTDPELDWSHPHIISDLKPTDLSIVQGRPAADGTPGNLVVTGTLPDGKVVIWYRDSKDYSWHGPASVADNAAV